MVIENGRETQKIEKLFLFLLNSLKKFKIRKFRRFEVFLWIFKGHFLGV
jgi:hypothetical protein